MKRLLACLIGLLPMTSMAQEVLPCDWQASARAVVEPWEDNSKIFSNGAVRLALLDVTEPASAAFYLLILSPPYDELGERQCRVIGFGDGLGFAYLSFEKLEAGYDPARGLTFTLPGQIYLPEQSFGNSLVMSITLNQATGEISIETQLGGE